MWNTISLFPDSDFGKIYDDSSPENPEATPDTTPEVTPDTTPEISPEVTSTPEPWNKEIFQTTRMMMKMIWFRQFIKYFNGGYQEIPVKVGSMRR